MKRDKILITGFSGFVSRHFLTYLDENNIGAEIVGIDVKKPDYNPNFGDAININFTNIDLLQYDDIKKVLEDFKPNYILHLAAYSSVAYSWTNPVESFKNNTNIFLNLVSAIKELNLKCRVLSVGSSEEYGNILSAQLPITEDMNLNPISPYAVARVSQEMLSKIYVQSYGLDIVLTRSFNHIGPYQDIRFVVPSFIHKILDIQKNGTGKGTIMTGDLSIIRDFVDVRDVVRAYYELLLHGECGEIYNVCSGKGISLESLIEIIAEYTVTNIETQVDSALIRANDNQKMIGSYDKLKKRIGWYPTISLEKTIKDMIEEQISRRNEE